MRIKLRKRKNVIESVLAKRKSIVEERLAGSIVCQHKVVEKIKFTNNGAEGARRAPADINLTIESC